jgi:hypothetical protein
MPSLHDSIYVKTKSRRNVKVKLTKHARESIIKLSSMPNQPTLNEVMNMIGCDAEKAKTILTSIKTKRNLLAKELQITLPGMRKTEEQGFVYLIKNPAFEGWVKCGMTIDCGDRLKSYNGYDPTSRFSFIATKEVANRRNAERHLLHETSLKASLQNGEWFKIDERICIEILKWIE